MLMGLYLENIVPKVYHNTVFEWIPRKLEKSAHADYSMMLHKEYKKNY